MIRLRLSPGDLERLRFAYSPLAEVAESLYVLHSGVIPDVHQGWFDKTHPGCGTWTWRSCAQSFRPPGRT